MPCAASSEHTAAFSGWRFRISHLFLLTLSIALGLWVWRLRGQPAIGIKATGSGYFPSSGLVEAPLGLRFSDLGNLLVPVAIWMTLCLLRSAALRIRGRNNGARVAERGIVPPRMALLGRVVLAGCFAVFVLLTIDVNTREFESQNMKGICEIREQWLAQAAAMLLFGLMLARRATWPTPAGRSRKRRLVRLLLPGAACPGWATSLRMLLLGGLVLAVITEAMIVPYLGIIVVLGITLARPPTDLPMERVDATLGERFAASLPSLAVTVAAGLVCIAWAVHVTRQSKRSATAPGGRAWSVYAVAVLLLVTASAHLIFGTVPYLSRFLAESFASLLDPVNMAVAVVGAGGLSLGLAARVALRPTSAWSDQVDPLHDAEPRSRHLWWLVRLAAGSALAATVAASVYAVHCGSTLAVRWPAVEALGDLADFIGMAALVMLLWMQPLLWTVGLAGMGIKLLIDRHRLAAGPVADARDGHSAEALPLFWMWWPLLTLVLLAAVPVAGIAGLLAFHGTVALGW